MIPETITATTFMGLGELNHYLAASFEAEINSLNTFTFWKRKSISPQNDNLIKSIIA